MMAMTTYETVEHENLRAVGQTIDEEKKTKRYNRRADIEEKNDQEKSGEVRRGGSTQGDNSSFSFDSISTQKLYLLEACLRFCLWHDCEDGRHYHSMQVSLLWMGCEERMSSTARCELFHHHPQQLTVKICPKTESWAMPLCRCACHLSRTKEQQEGTTTSSSS